MHEHSQWAERLAYLFAGVAAVSFWQGIALAVTIIAGLISISLGLLRWHDRLKYGKTGE